MSNIAYNPKASARLRNRVTVSVGRLALSTQAVRDAVRIRLLTLSAVSLCGLGIVLALVAWL